MTQQKTFHIKGLTISLQPTVYEPAEDTYQLLDAITIHPNDIVLELGTGCGLIALECARQGAHVICTDLNPHAVEVTQYNITQNQHLLKGSIEVRHGDLFNPIKKNEQFTLIIFNPPYLPLKRHEHSKEDKWLDLATDGGITGLKTTKKFLTQVPKFLKKDGYAYFIFSSLANRTILTQHLTRLNLQAEILSTCHFIDESLDVYRISLP
ncbi:MAG: HemK2/MTQ2 family protein methyltransferase [Methanobacteriota archaeon]